MRNDATVASWKPRFSVALAALLAFATPSSAFEVESESESNTIRFAIDDRIDLANPGALSIAVVSIPEWIEITDVSVTGTDPAELIIQFDVARVSSGTHGLLQLQIQAPGSDGDISFSRDLTIALTAAADAPPMQESFAVLECCLTEASTDGVLSAPQDPGLVVAAPNPFRSLVHFVFGLPDPGGRVTLEVFDASGRMVSRRESPHLLGGFHRITWDGRDVQGLALPGGTYFGRISSGFWSETTKVQLVR